MYRAAASTVPTDDGIGLIRARSAGRAVYRGRALGFDRFEGSVGVVFGRSAERGGGVLVGKVSVDVGNLRGWKSLMLVQ